MSRRALIKGINLVPNRSRQRPLENMEPGQVQCGKISNIVYFTLMIVLGLSANYQKLLQLLDCTKLSETALHHIASITIWLKKAQLFFEILHDHLKIHVPQNVFLRILYAVMKYQISCAVFEDVVTKRFCPTFLHHFLSVFVF